MHRVSGCQDLGLPLFRDSIRYYTNNGEPNEKVMGNYMDAAVIQGFPRTGKRLT